MALFKEIRKAVISAYDVIIDDYYYTFCLNGRTLQIRRVLFNNQVKLNESELIRVIYLDHDANECSLAVHNKQLLVYVNHCTNQPEFLVLDIDGQIVQRYHILSVHQDLIIDDMFLSLNEENQPILWTLSCKFVNKKETFVHRFDLIAGHVDLIIKQSESHTYQFIYDPILQTLNVCQETANGYRTLMINMTTLSFVILPTRDLRLIACTGTSTATYWYEKPVTRQIGNSELVMTNEINLIVTDDELEYLTSYWLRIDKIKANHSFRYVNGQLYLSSSRESVPKVTYILGPFYSLHFHPHNDVPNDLRNLFLSVMLCRTDQNVSLNCLPIEIMFEIFAIVYVNYNWLNNKLLV